MAKKKVSSFRKKFNEFKEKPTESFGIVVPMDEVGEGESITCYPLRPEDITDLVENYYVDGVDPLLQEWAIVIKMYRDESGLPEFTDDDVDTLEKFGSAMKLKLQFVANDLAGTNKKYSITRS